MVQNDPESQKLFSIIIPTFNCGAKVRETLKSVFSQDPALFEVIVIDGASTDSTLDHIQPHAEDLTLVSEADNGIYHAFNKGIDLARGRYLYFIGAGDRLRQGILTEIKDELPENEGTPALVYGKSYYTREKYERGCIFTSRRFIRDNICQQGIFYHRDIFRLAGTFDTRYKVLADWFFNLKCFLDRRITKKHVDRVIADYEEGGLSERRRDEVFIKDFPIFVRQNFGLRSSLICKAFLRYPHLVNHVYRFEFFHLAIHLASWVMSSKRTATAPAS